MRNQAKKVSASLNFNFKCVVKIILKTMLISTELYRPESGGREMQAKTYFMVNKTSKIGSTSVVG